MSITTGCRKLLLLLPCIIHSASAAWTATQYARLGPGTTITGLGGTTTPSTLLLLSTTGPVSPTSTSTTTTVIGLNVEVVLTATLTYLLLAPDASATTCLLSRLGLCEPDNTPTPPPGAAAISTLVFAPIVIQNPASCTRTSFSYTTSVSIRTGGLPPTIAQQATESAQAALVTTRTVVVSTNLGGQAVMTTQADIYLSAGAVVLLPDQLPGFLTKSLLNECVDPYSIICNPKSTLGRESWACGPTVYPPTGQNAGPTGGPGGGPGSGQGGSGPKNGAAGKAGGYGLLELLASVMLTAWRIL